MVNVKPIAEDIDTLELKIAIFFRYGVLFAGTLMLIGWMSRLSFRENPLREFSTYHAQPLREALMAAWSSGNYGLMLSYLGLFALIALPTFRVLMTSILFMRSREWRLAAAAAFVLGTLFLSFFLGIES